MAFDIVESADNAADPDEPDAALFTRTGEPYDSKSMSRAVHGKLQVLETAWTPHDARRTTATGMAAIGIQPHVIEAVLNHISGFRSGVAGLYNRNAYEPEKRAALDKWADHLTAVIEGKKAGNVYQLHA
jgi:integrase